MCNKNASLYYFFIIRDLNQSQVIPFLVKYLEILYYYCKYSYKNYIYTTIAIVVLVCRREIKQYSMLNTTLTLTVEFPLGS